MIGGAVVGVGELCSSEGCAGTCFGCAGGPGQARGEGKKAIKYVSKEMCVSLIPNYGC